MDSRVGHDWRASDRTDGAVLAISLHSAMYSAIQEPVSGVTQIVDQFAGTKYLPKVQFMEAPKQAQFGTLEWHAQQVGSAVGMLLPFMLAGKGVRGVIGKAGVEEASLIPGQAAFGMSMKEAGLTGFAYDAVLRPSEANKGGMGFLLDRTTQGAVGAGTFMMLTGAGMGLNRFAGSEAMERSALVPLLKNPIASGIISGVPAGLFSAEANSLTKTGHIASGTELVQSVYGMSIIGGAFGIAHTLKSSGVDGKIDSFTGKRRENLQARLLGLADFQDQLAKKGVSIADVIGSESDRNFIHSGVEHNVYHIPAIPEYVLRVARSTEPPVIGAQALEAVPDPLPGENFGQPIALINNRLEVLKRVNGEPYGVLPGSVFGRSIEDEQLEAALHYDGIRRIASFPQQAYDNLAKRLITAANAGLKFDGMNPNNILLDAKRGALNPIDFQQTGQPLAVDVADMLEPLVKRSRLPRPGVPSQGIEESSDAHPLQADYRLVIEKTFNAAEKAVTRIFPQWR